jgi:thiamine biosynthesis protein ThiI
MSKHVILVRYGEISLKGLNRNYFIDLLVKNIRNTLRYLPSAAVRKVQGRIIVDIDESELDQGLESIQRVFGIVSVSPAVVVESRMEVIEEAVVAEAKSRDFKTFRVSAKRSDKRFPMKSPDIGRYLGGVILKNIPDISVAMTGADMDLWVEVREETYIYSQFIPCGGGLPVGCSGKSVLLLSGGIDSPVAGYMMAKRGIHPICVYFHSFPFTSDRAKEKVIDLGRILARYIGRMDIYVVPFTDIQTKIVELCPERQTTIIIRRYMMRIAQGIADKVGAKSLITGESLGQVASQTQEGLQATDSIAAVPVFRPLIGMDKQEIVTIAEKIGTFETSILPYEDCCTIFVPKHPETKPKLSIIEASEKDMEAIAAPMIQKAIDDSEIVRV